MLELPPPLPDTIVLADPRANANVQLKSRNIRLRDLAEGGDFGELVVAQIPENETSTLLTSADQQRLIRNRLPGQHLKLKYRVSLLLFVNNISRSDPKPSRVCYETKAPLSADSFVARADLEEVACHPKRPHVRLAFNRTAKTPYTPVNLPARSYVGPVWAPLTKPIAIGTAMTLRTISGPVTIEQSAVSLQPGRLGQKVFVQTADRQVFSEKLGEPLVAEVLR